MKGTGIYTVYAHKNRANGKIYIGVTQKPLYARFDNGHGYEKCTRFWNDIVKYGFDNFEHIAIKGGLGKDEAMEMERVLIDTFDTMNPERGYNMRKGGYHNIPCEDVGRAISKAKMGHIVTDETRKKLSEYGGRKVVKVSLDGVELAVYNSLTEAARDVGTFKSNIWAACAGKKPTSRGYRWRYLDNWNNAKAAEEKDRVKHDLSEPQMEDV